MGSSSSALALTICPLTGVPFQDPVTAPDGHTYSRHAIEQWIRSWKEINGRVLSPLTHEPMDISTPLLPDKEKREAVQREFAAAKSSTASNFPDSKLASPSTQIARTMDGQITSIYELNRVFVHLDSLRDLLSRVVASWQPPQIVVIGEESTGKSTVLERLLMMSLFPRAEGVCTRVRIHVRLRHTESSSTPRLEVIDADSGSTVRGPFLIAAENGHDNVSREMGKLVAEEHGNSKGVCSSRIIVLYIDGPHLPSIDLVDLPGLVQAPASMAESTRALVDEQIREHNKYSMYLAVVPAGRRPTSSAALKVVDDHNLQTNTLGVFTHCDELAAPAKRSQLRRWLTHPEEFGIADCHYPLKPHGWVATSNPPISEQRPNGIEASQRQSHGSLLRLQRQAQNEVQFFQHEGMQDLLDSNLVGTSALLSRLQAMYSEYLLRTWAPLTIFRLNRETERLDYEVAVFGFPPANKTLAEEPLERLRKLAVSVAAQTLQDEVSEFSKRMAQEVLAPLQENVLGVIGVEITMSTDELNTKWYSLKSKLQSICEAAAKHAADCLTSSVSDTLRRKETPPPWPSVEAERLIQQRPFMLWRFPAFVSAIMKNMKVLAAAWKERLVPSMAKCVERLFEVASPWVHMRTKLHANPPTLKVTCANEDVVGAIVAAFVQHSIEIVIQELVASLARIADGVVDWLEEKAEERTQLMIRGKEIQRARTELLELLGGRSKNPPSLVVLEKISLARCICSGVGISRAWTGRTMKMHITLHDREGAILPDVLPPDQDFEVALHDVLADHKYVTAATMTHDGKGTHTGTYKVPDDALGKDVLLNVELHGSPVVGSPFKVTLSAEPRWEHVSKFGVNPKTGDVLHPSSIAVDAEHIYVADTNSQRIHVVSVFDKRVSSKPTWVLDEGTLSPIAERGSFIRSFGENDNLQTPYGMAADAHFVYVSDSTSNRLLAYSKEDYGIVHSTCLQGKGVGEFDGPRGVAVDKERVYAVDSGNHRVQVFAKNKDGSFIAVYSFGSAGSGAGHLRSPTDLALDGDVAHVVDAGGVHVFRLPKGEFLRSYAIQGPSEGEVYDPSGVAIGGPFAYVSDVTANCIGVYDKDDGSFISTLGQRGDNNGEFREPVCLTATGSHLYVTERGNNRVQIFHDVDAANGCLANGFHA